MKQNTFRDTIIKLVEKKNDSGKDKNNKKRKTVIM